MNQDILETAIIKWKSHYLIHILKYFIIEMNYEKGRLTFPHPLPTTLAIYVKVFWRTCTLHTQKRHSSE